LTVLTIVKFKVHNALVLKYPIDTVKSVLLQYAAIVPLLTKSFNYVLVVSFRNKNNL